MKNYVTRLPGKSGWAEMQKKKKKNQHSGAFPMSSGRFYQFDRLRGYTSGICMCMRILID